MHNQIYFKYFESWASLIRFWHLGLVHVLSANPYLIIPSLLNTGNLLETMGTDKHDENYDRKMIMNREELCTTETCVHTPMWIFMYEKWYTYICGDRKIKYSL